MTFKLRQLIGFRVLFAAVFILSVQASRAQDCSAIFPGAAQNSTAGGSVNFGWGSRLINTPGNTIATRNLNDNAGPNTSCNGVSCTSLNSTVPPGDQNNYPNTGIDISLNWNETASAVPGAYEDLWLNSSATLNMAPGVYTFRGSFQMLSDATIEVSAPGTVTIFVRGSIQLQNAAIVNSANTDRYVFLFSRQDISLGSNVSVHAVLYSRDDVFFTNGASVTGAVTARDDINLNSATSITYDANAVANTDYDVFCDQYIPPDLVAEWRLDALTWSGVADEVVDYSGNNLHGRALDPFGAPTVLPATSLDTPAISGNPGTCRYGNFNGSADGFLQIDDPGTDSILDLTEFTVTSWIYPRRWANTGLMTILSKDENFEYHLNTSGQVNWWWGGGSRELTTAASVPINSWHHIAITYESGRQVIYIDGVQAATHNDTVAITLNNDPVQIGEDLNFPSRLFDGFIDEVRIYDGPLNQSDVAAVMSETHPCLDENLLDHFSIDAGAGTASTCVPATITITAEDDANNTLLDYVGGITISTSSNHGDWSKTVNGLDAQGDLTPGPADTGTAEYTFEVNETDGGAIVLNLANTHAETLSITVNDTDAGVSSTSAAITFSENAFVVTSSDALGDDVVAGRDHSFLVQMIKNDPVTGSCGAAAEYDVSDVKVWLSRASSDPSGAAPGIVTASEAEVLPAAEPASNNVTLPFVDGEASFTLQTSDVGRYSLQFKDDTSGYSDLEILGGSATLVARPFALDIQVSGNPAASSSNGAVFVHAGDDFTATVRAVLWQGQDDINLDGIADGHDDNDPTNNANLSDNGVTPGFGAEVPAEGVQLASTLQLPAAGNDPGLATSSSPDGRQLLNFSSGVAVTSTLYFAEVGIIELSAQVLSGNYLNTGNVFSDRIQGRSGFVGRFYPNHFVVVPGALTPACVSGGFSYMDQPFASNFTLDVRNVQNQLTTNYAGGFAKLDPDTGLGSVDFGALDTISGTDLSSRSGGNTLLNWVNGSATASAEITLSRLTVSGAVSKDGPFTDYTLGVSVFDSDNVTLRLSDLDLDTNLDSTFDYVNLGSQVQYFGRLRLADAFGPETASLPVVFVTELWNGADWVQNNLDDCTAVALSAITYVPTGSIDSLANRTVPVASGATTGIYANLTGNAVNFTGGDAGHSFTPPGTGNTGSFQVDINLMNYPWLRFDWNNDGDNNESSLPSATYTFGSYRGHDRVIFWREVL